MPSGGVPRSWPRAPDPTGPDPTNAELRQACEERGNVVACGAMARRLFHSDPETGAEFAAEGCKHGSAVSCRVAADAAEDEDEKLFCLLL